MTFNDSSEERLKDGLLVALDIDVSAPMALLNKTHLTDKPEYLSADIVEGEKIQKNYIKGLSSFGSSSSCIFDGTVCFL